MRRNEAREMIAKIDAMHERQRMHFVPWYRREASGLVSLVALSLFCAAVLVAAIALNGAGQ